MLLANIVIIDDEKVKLARNGGNYDVSGSAYIRFEPAFVFETTEVRICILSAASEIVAEFVKFVSRDTVAVFQEMPELAAGSYRFILSIAAHTTTEFQFETLGTSSKLLSAKFAGEAETNYGRLRYLTQAKPFDQMLRETRSLLDINGAHLVIVTGSVGKTTTKELLTHVLRVNHDVLSSTDSWNFPHEICSQIQNNVSWCRLFVMEAALGRHLPLMGELLPPDTFIFTAVGAVHTALTSDVSEIANYKASLGAHMRSGSTIVCDLTDDRIGKAIGDLDSVKDGRAEVIGLQIGKSCDQRVSVQKIDNHYRISNRTIEPAVEFDCPEIFGIAPTVLGCVFAAWSVLNGAPSDVDRFCTSLKEFPGVPGRLEWVQLGSIAVVNDAYNSNPVSMGQFFARLRELESQGRRVLAVVGEMRDLGSLTDSAHDLVASQACGSGIKTIFVGDIYRGRVDQSLEVIPSKELGSLDERVIEILKEYDVIAFKGSYATGIFGAARRIIDRIRKEVS